MQLRKMQLPRSRALRPLAAALLAAASGASRADEPSPWYIGASESITHDSNVYRVPDGIGDSYSSTSLLGGFDQSIGRQRLYATGTVGYNKYRDQTSLDNTSYSLNAGWDWATIEKLSGSVTLGANQNLASLDGNSARPVTGRNILKTDQIGTSVHWGGEGLLSLDANYGHSRVRYSASESLTSQSSADTASLGGNYRIGGSTTIGAAFRVTRTLTPYAVANVPFPTGPDDYSSNTANGRNLDLLFNWRASGQTGLNARLSWTRQSNSQIGLANFSGLTGSLSGNYAPTGKLVFTASLARDAGTNASYFNTVSTQTGLATTGLSQNSQTSDSLTLSGTYAATAKISATAGFQYRRSKQLYQTGAGGAAFNNDQTDSIRGATLGVSWAIARAWSLGCNYSHESRSVTGPAGYAYGDNTIACSAQVTLR